VNNAVPNRTAGATGIALLAIAQAAFGVLRALGWFHSGSDLMGQGLLLLPLIGVLAYARGALIAGIALLYIFFAWAYSKGHPWARPVGFIAAVVNVLLVLSVLIQGELIAHALLWLIVPVTVVWYLLAPAGVKHLRVSRISYRFDCG
jgi:hypothetical protein